MKIGKKLKEFRTRNNFKQEELATSLYVSNFLISKMESEQAQMTDSFLFIWKTKFCINEKWLVNDKEPMVVVPRERENYLPILPSTVHPNQLKDEFEYIGFIEITPEELRNINKNDIIVIRVVNKQPFAQIGDLATVSLVFDDKNLNGSYLVEYQEQLSIITFPIITETIYISLDNKIKKIPHKDLKIIGKKIHINSVDSLKPL